jgi:hypothetical protein
MVPDETWRNEAVKKLAKALTSLQLGLEAVEEGVDVRSFSFARPVGPTARPQPSPAGLGQSIPGSAERRRRGTKPVIVRGALSVSPSQLDKVTA